MSAAKDAAKDAVRQGDLDASNKSKEVQLRAARQQVSFLNSGLTLDGTPMAAIQSTFKTGLDDINLIQSNAQRRSNNIYSQGRTQAIGTIASGFSGISTSGGGSGISDFKTSAMSYLPEQSLFSLNDAGFGADAYSALEKQDIRNGFY